MTTSRIYAGTVAHRRLRPKPHRLRYRVFSLLLDLDEIAALDRGLRLFSHNRFNLFGFHDRDHALGDGAPPRRHVERHLAAAGIDLDGGRIRLLCYPRVLGYVFNPLSVYFCHHRKGDLRAILYEVTNTFGERHGYLIPVDGSQGSVIRQRCAKALYVSPFMAMAQTYDFRILPPNDDGVTVAIRQEDADGPILDAAFVGEPAQPLTDRTLLRLFVGQPLMTLKVVAGIHWEALRLWRKGVPLVERPAPPANPVTLVDQ